MTREEAIREIETIKQCEVDTMKQIQALDMALSVLRPVSREQVEKVWRGQWVKCKHADYYVCNKCSTVSKTGEDEFCKSCGAPMTDEAVDMMLERWKEAVDGESNRRR